MTRIEPHITKKRTTKYKTNAGVTVIKEGTVSECREGGRRYFREDIFIRSSLFLRSATFAGPPADDVGAAVDESSFEVRTELRCGCKKRRALNVRYSMLPLNWTKVYLVLSTKSEDAEDVLDDSDAGRSERSENFPETTKCCSYDFNTNASDV